MFHKLTFFGSLSLPLRSDIKIRITIKLPLHCSESTLMAARAAPIVRGRSFFMRAGTFLPIIGESGQISAYAPQQKSRCRFYVWDLFMCLAPSARSRRRLLAVCRMHTCVCKKRTSIATISCFSSAFSSPLRGF